MAINPRKSKVAYKVGKYSSALYNYWRSSLEEGFRLEEASKLKTSSFIKVLESELLLGKLSLSIYESMRERSRLNNKKFKEKESYGIVISPFSMRESIQGKRGEVLYPLLIPALVSHDGILSPSEHLPFIQRGYLDPAGDDHLPLLGTIERAEKYFSKYPNPNIRNITFLLKYAEDFFKFVSGNSYEDFSHPDYEVVKGFSVGPFEYNQGSINKLIFTLEDIIEGKRNPNLLQSAITRKKIVRKLYARSKYGLYSNAKMHLAHFSPQHSLSRSQRVSLHRILETPQGELVPVSGPPGTGKTTLLQNVIINYWTKSALDKALVPPVMVVCGATNQSVLNVISSFDSDQCGIKRWLPDTSSYGLFCSSFSRAEEVGKYQVEQLDGSGFCSQVENQAYLENAKKFYLEHVSGYYNKKLSLKSAINILHADLRSEYVKLRANLGLDFNLSLKEFIFSKFLSLSEGEINSYLDILAQHDCVIRHKMFLLASHYWEARWLMSLEKLLGSKEFKEREGLAQAKEDWMRRAMLTPVFVSTLSMVCKFFGPWETRDVAPIDLLFFDEAGQIPPEKGVAPLALSNKAVVIGDTKQLSPYTSIPENIDQANLVRGGILKSYDDASFSELARKGITASSSNLMELATSFCRRDDGQIIGASLVEHRRSVPEIAQFCNVLCYHNRLKPMRPKPEKVLFPAFSYVDVEGAGLQVGSSRRNQEEARAIYSWLKLNSKIISSFYGNRPLSEVLACITPFTQQAILLENLLHKDWPGMLVGTVHSIQGAEREIVIFSSVYDINFGGEYFFDRDTRTLNVAVSRAKDSFIVFGDMDIFENGNRKDSPSSLLGEFLFRKQENDLG